MDETIRILMLEDLEDDVGLVKRVLWKDGMKFEIQQVDSREEFEEALQSNSPDVILSDHALPQFNSIEALEIRQQRMPNVPFILVTGAVSEEFAAQCIRLGADDYVLKSNLTRLPNSIKNALETRNMEQKRREYAEAVERQNIELSKINKELDSFIYSVSHNLRSPLSSVLGLINIAKIEGARDPAVHMEYLEMIKKSIDKLDETIREMLDYSQNARIELTYETIDLEKLAEECLQRLEYLELYKQVSKEFDVKGNVLLSSDSHRVRILLSSLFSNAIKYADVKKESSWIKMKATISSTEATILITDNGVGIREEYQPFIFDMFYRANNSVPGAGLGLFIAREIIDKLKGSLKISSEPNQGTSVELIIPNKLQA